MNETEIQARLKALELATMAIILSLEKVQGSDIQMHLSFVRSRFADKSDDREMAELTVEYLDAFR